jgi:hypothetical protein
MTRWVDGGNEAKGFLAFGNLATGFIAFGNVARGFIAVGNLAIGVIAIGNVGFGVIAGGGATIGIGMFAFAGVLALPVLDGTAGIGAMTDFAPVLGFIPLALWGLMSMVLKGERPPLPEKPPLVDPALLAKGDVREGWVEGRLRADGTEGNGPIPLVANGTTLTIELTKEAADELPVVAKRKVLVQLRTEERVAASAQSYREAPEMERFLVATRLVAAPPPRVPWSDGQHIQWWLAWAWRVGAAVGAVAWIVYRAIA